MAWHNISLERSCETTRLSFWESREFNEGNYTNSGSDPLRLEMPLPWQGLLLNTAIVGVYKLPTACVCLVGTCVTHQAAYNLEVAYALNEPLAFSSYSGELWKSYRVLMHKPQSTVIVADICDFIHCIHI